MAPPARLTFVTIGAQDITALRAFYGRIGFVDRFPQIPDFAAFPVNGVVLALYEREKLAAEADPGGAVPPIGGFNGIALACNVDEIDQVDAAWQAWVGAGATPVHEPVTRPEIGVRSGYVADPEGNRWEIAWAPGLEFGDDGQVTRFGP
jgi:predicted lactoylglutathione lyase